MTKLHDANTRHLRASLNGTIRTRVRVATVSIGVRREKRKTRRIENGTGQGSGGRDALGVVVR